MQRKKDIRVPEIADQIADEFGLSQSGRDQLLPSGRQKILHNRLHWAKFYLSKAGLVSSAGKNRFIATDAGRQLLSSKPSKIDNELLLKYPNFQEFYHGNGDSESEKSTGAHATGSVPAFAATTTPEEQIEAAHVAVQSALKAELLQRILQNSPSFFEHVIVELLVGMGYGGSHQNAATQLGRTGDGGVDGVIKRRPLGP